MDWCDVLVVGGGPAGSSCARALVAAGLDVAVVDAAVFPRDKPCAGWLTPQTVAALDLDVDEYRRSRTWQVFTGFRVGVIGSAREVETAYGRDVSVGIRRLEFDDYLLRRSGARLHLGVPVSSLRREGSVWIVNERLAAPVIVGAGGHQCPVARRLNGPTDPRRCGALVVARETEFPIAPGERAAFATPPATPLLYFCRDLLGYGWCIRKGDYVNVGLGRLQGHALPAAAAAFQSFLASRGEVPGGASWPWRGHAYLVSHGVRAHVVGAGVLLAGDAAGLAYPESGEGIRTAVSSGLLAARTIVAAQGDYAHERLAPYERALGRHLAAGRMERWTELAPPGLTAALGRLLLRSPAFVRHVVLDRWFLHAREPVRPSGTRPRSWMTGSA